MPFVFIQPAWLALALLAPLLVYLWKRRHPPVGHSNAATLAKLRSVNLLAAMPALLFVLAFGTLAAALARPQVSQDSAAKVIQARDVMWVVDISGNMNEAAVSRDYYGGGGPGGYGNGPVSNPTPTPASKTPTSGCGNSARDWGTLKQNEAAYALCTFATKSTGNRIGVAAFDGNAYIYAPLVVDPNIVVKKSYVLNTITETDGNSNFDGPFAANQEGVGGFQIAVDHLVRYSQADTKVIVMITDGDGSIDAGRAKALEAQMKALGIHLYVLGPGDDSVYGDPPSNDINAMTAAYGGKVIDGTNSAEMQKLIDEIDALPTSAVKLDQHLEHQDLYQYFLVASMVLWLAFLGANAMTRQTA